MACLAVSQSQYLALQPMLKKRTCPVCVTKEGPGEGVRLKDVTEAGFTTHVFDAGLEVSTSGVASSVGASGIGVSAFEASC